MEENRQTKEETAENLKTLCTLAIVESVEVRCAARRST